MEKSRCEGVSYINYFPKSCFCGFTKVSEQEGQLGLHCWQTEGDTHYRSVLLHALLTEGKVGRTDRGRASHTFNLMYFLYSSLQQ